MTALIALKNVTYQYENANSNALNDVSVTITANEWVSVIGRNGSGKSTFGRLLNGIIVPSQGSVNVSGYSTLIEDEVWDIRKVVGMVFQNPDHQFVATTVRDDLAFGLENLGLTREVMEERITKYASLIGITPLLEEEPHRLSGGQKQRVAIAGVMAMEPRVIVFDESTSMLDPIGRKEVIETMHLLHQQGITIITITHDMDEAVIGSRILLFNNGEIVLDGQSKEVFSQADVVTDYGVSLPFSIELQNQLEEQGISLPDTCLTQEELISELWTLYSAK
ncbi:energy-coupling factor transporter ATPase [Halalkalibacter kiskunsagensis]|uniref:Energy-coupling factor transporter ATPase n=1 Tax=Halalkalibacter kiskunsagensis TaxID=1548599 RepID=A0ABV6K8T6_9BACI